MDTFQKALDYAVRTHCQDIISRPVMNAYEAGYTDATKESQSLREECERLREALNRIEVLADSPRPTGKIYGDQILSIAREALQSPSINKTK